MLTRSISGDPKKNAAVRAVHQYFVGQTRKQEINEILQVVGSDRDRFEACKKLEATEKELKGVAASRVSQPDEHFDKIRRRGHQALFEKSPAKVKADWGIPSDREIADFAKPVIVKGMDFAAELTTEQVRSNSALKGVNKICAVNEENHAGVRRVMLKGGVPPESLSAVEDIRNVERRLDKQRLKLLKKHGDAD